MILWTITAAALLFGSLWAKKDTTRKNCLIVLLTFLTCSVTLHLIDCHSGNPNHVITD